MDKTLMDTCRITGIKKTSENASEFVVCTHLDKHNDPCMGITHKSALEGGRECRCSYCGEPISL